MAIYSALSTITINNGNLTKSSMLMEEGIVEERSDESFLLPSTRLENGEAEGRLYEGGV